MGRRLCPRLRSAAFAFDHSFAHKLSVFLISAAGRLHAVRAKAAVREKRGRHALQVVQPVVSIQVQNHARISFR